MFNIHICYSCLLPSLGADLSVRTWMKVEALAKEAVFSFPFVMGIASNQKEGDRYGTHDM